ncbi:hypothetical protein P43SY_000316 [Pythium insidiosum]|uniref:Uncharacterized protein n=1 Tax=Pythium insidiosum TaxID=114742 RepID=A0AAD5LAL4_PYTIN|nr:hypothetical protein P43SY_000316 [Pythium insidiosum]
MAASAMDVGDALVTPLPSTSTDIFRTSVTVYFPLLLLAVLVFELLRRRKPHVFERENHGAMADSDRARCFAWISFLFSVTDQEIISHCGLDAWVFLRFLRIGEKVAALVIACSFVLFPLYATATPAEMEESPHAAFPVGAPSLANTTSPDDPDGGLHVRPFESFDQLSIANVEAGDWRLWFAVTTAYVVTLAVMHLVKEEYVAYMRHRHAFLSRRDAQQYSVVVTDLPKRLRRPQPLLTYIDYLFPDAVHHVYVGVECRHLEKLLETRAEVQYRYNAALSELQALESKHAATAVSAAVRRPRLVLSRRWLGLCGKHREVDAVDYFREELDRLNKEVEDEYRSIRERQLDEAQLSRASYGSTQSTLRSWSSLRDIGAEEERAARLRQTTFSRSSTAGENATLLSTDSLPILESEPSEKELRPAGAQRRSSGAKLRWLARHLVWGLIGRGSSIALSFSAPGDSLAVMRNAAFVSFRSLRAAQSAQQLLQTENPVKLRVHAAPHIHDVVWENFGLPHHLKSTWGLLSAVLTFLVVCFWTVPTAFVTSLASVQQLRRASPFWERAISEHLWVQRVIEQVAPLLLVAMNALAYVLFRFLALREGHLSLSEVDASVFTKLCYFQVFQMFFVSAVTGSVLAQLMALADEPKRVLFILGGSIASQSLLFATFTIVQICVTLPVFALRVIPLLKDRLHALLAPAYAQRPTRQPWLGGLLYPLDFFSDLDPAYSLAQQFLIFLLVLVFAPIAPLLGYTGLLFFLCAEIVYRRHYLFVNKRHWAPVASTGVFWPPLFQFVLGALLIAQATLIGLLSLKGATVPQLLASATLPFGTMLFHWYIVTLHCLPTAAQFLPLDRCCDLDRARRDDALDFLDGVYQQPAMAQAVGPCKEL